MPNRDLKDSNRRSASLQLLSDAAERLWYRIITSVDDFGRMEAHPEVVLSNCFQRPPKGWTPQKVATCLAELSTLAPPGDQPLIRLYQVKRKEYLHILSAELYIYRRASKSKWPAPPEQDEEKDAAVSSELTFNTTGPVAAASVTVQPIVDRWNAIPGVRICKVVEEKLKTRLKALMRDKSGAWWDQFFGEVGKSPFLTGKVQPKEGRRVFRADLWWATGPENLSKIMSGNYDDPVERKAAAPSRLPSKPTTPPIVGEDPSPESAALLRRIVPGFMNDQGGEHDLPRLPN